MKALGFPLAPRAGAMAPGKEGGGAGDGGDDAALVNGGGGGSTNGVASAAAAPVPAAAAAPLLPQRSLGGFKIKVKLPPRQPSGDGGGAGVSAGGGMMPSSAPDANAASMKRPAEGPPADVGGAPAAPQKLKITLK